MPYCLNKTNIYNCREVILEWKWSSYICVQTTGGSVIGWAGSVDFWPAQNSPKHFFLDVYRAIIDFMPLTVKQDLTLCIRRSGTCVVVTARLDIEYIGNLTLETLWRLIYRDELVTFERLVWQLPLCGIGCRQIIEMHSLLNLFNPF